MPNLEVRTIVKTEIITAVEHYNGYVTVIFSRMTIEPSLVHAMC